MRCATCKKTIKKKQIKPKKRKKVNTFVFKVSHEHIVLKFN